MAGSKCLYLENASLDIVLGGTPWTAPSIIYIALSTALFDKNSTGSSLGEVSSASTGYTRVAVTNNATNWPNASNGGKSNGAIFTFPTAAASWGTVQSFYILDAASSGNALYGADLATARTINTGDTASFGVASINLTEL